MLLVKVSFFCYNGLGQVFITAADARPGNMLSKPLVMAAQRVCGVGLKSAARRKARRSGRGSIASMLLHFGFFLALKCLSLSN